MRLTMMVWIGALSLAGCGGSERPAAPSATPTNAAPQKSTAREAIEGFTGKTAVDAGMRAKAKLQKIDAERQKDAEEAAKW
jgi:hypothetical protein